MYICRSLFCHIYQLFGSFDSSDLDFYNNAYHIVIATLHNLPNTRVLDKHEMEFKQNVYLSHVPEA